MLAALRDFRIWMLIALGAVLSSAMWVVLGLYVASTMVQREQSLSRLTPDERMQAELRMVDRLSQEVLGQRAGLEVEDLEEERQRLMDELEAKGLGAEGAELIDDMQDDIDALRQSNERAQQGRAVSPPPPGFVPQARSSEPVSPLLAALGCGSAIFLFGVLGTVLLFRPGSDA